MRLAMLALFRPPVFCVSGRFCTRLRTPDCVHGLRTDPQIVRTVCTRISFVDGTHVCKSYTRKLELSSRIALKKYLALRANLLEISP